MTKLEKLLADLCPDGVEYVPLGEIVPSAGGVRIAIIPEPSSWGVLWAIAQKNGVMRHIRHLLLKKEHFLSNSRLVCLKAGYCEAISPGGVA
jgi:hypothetical protein